MYVGSLFLGVVGSRSRQFVGLSFMCVRRGSFAVLKCNILAGWLGDLYSTCFEHGMRNTVFLYLMWFGIRYLFFGCLLHPSGVTVICWNGIQWV